jgi:hypothetical protein
MTSRRHWLIALVFFGAVGISQADTPAPSVTYLIPVGDSHVFVMLSDGFAWGGAREEETPNEKEIRAKYSKSGLYRKDQPDQPIWTIDWYAYPGSVRLSCDGDYLIWTSAPELMSASFREDRNAASRPEMLKRTAITFYARGQELRSVEIRDVVSEPSEIPASVAHVWWLKSGKLNDEEQSFTVEALDGTRTVFDFTTGKLMHKERPRGRLWRWLFGVSGLFALAGVGGWLIARRRTRPVSNPPAGSRPSEK